MTGDFQMMVFDLLNDPNEMNDLYGTDAVANDQVSLVLSCIFEIY